MFGFGVLTITKIKENVKKTSIKAINPYSLGRENGKDHSKRHAAF